MTDVRDANGDRIVIDSYVRLPDGKHAFVVSIDRQAGRITVEMRNGGWAYFASDMLVTVRPSRRALSMRAIGRAERKALSAAAHRTAGRSIRPGSS